MFHVKILSKEDIMQVIEMQPVIQCVEDVYKLKSEGDTVVWPTTFYEFDPGHADMDIKSGYLKGAKIFGHKTVSWFGANKEKGLPDLVGVIVVFDATNGLPIGILDGGYITGLRTGAAGAIGAKYLARPESETLFVLGAGNQAAFQIAAMLTLFPGLKKILVADMPDPQNAERFIEALPKRLAEEFGIDASGVTLEANSKLEEPNLSPEHLEQTRQRLEELAARPMTEERIQELTRDGLRVAGARAAADHDVFEFRAIAAQKRHAGKL